MYKKEIGKVRGPWKNKPVGNLRLIRIFVFFFFYSFPSNAFNFFKSFSTFNMFTNYVIAKELFTVAIFPIWLKSALLCSSMYLY